MFSILLSKSVTIGGFLTIGLCVNISKSGLSCSEGGGGRIGIFEYALAVGLGRDTVEPCGEPGGIDMEACMSGSGSLINTTGPDKE